MLFCVGMAGATIESAMADLASSVTCPDCKHTIKKRTAQIVRHWVLLKVSAQEVEPIISALLTVATRISVQFDFSNSIQKRRWLRGTITSYACSIIDSPTTRASRESFRLTLTFISWTASYFDFRCCIVLIFLNMCFDYISF